MTSFRIAESSSANPSREDVLFPGVAGSLLGAAAADALGWITEFVRGKDHLQKLYKTDLVTEYRAWEKTSGGRFIAHVDRIEKGEYSDDTQLSLAVARSLLADGTVDVEHLAKAELPLWRDYARGAGSSVTAAAKGLARKNVRWNRNFYTYTHRGQQLDYRDAGGNGGAMRVGPIALANPGRPEAVSDGVWRSTVVTHGHPRAIFGGLLYGHALRLCLEGRGSLTREGFLEDLSAVIAQEQPPDDPEFQEWVTIWDRGSDQPFATASNLVRKEVLAELEYLKVLPTADDPIHEYMQRLGCFRPETKGSATATVLAALGVFLQAGRDVRNAIVRTVNQLGSDTDTIGAFVGGLCGALHSYDSIPHEWASELQDYDYFLRVATEISRIAAGEGIGGRALLPERTGELADLPDLLTSLRSDDLNLGERAYHPLFGPGWVNGIKPQPLRRKDGGKVVYARVQFDLGQSCKFKDLRIPRRSQSRPN